VPRYFFNVFNDEITLDEEGAELSDLDEAREFALRSARSLVCDSVKNGHLNLDHRIEIEDDSGARRMTLTFREAFTIEG
jgi:hypothetical protein